MGVHGRVPFALISFLALSGAVSSMNTAAAGAEPAAETSAEPSPGATSVPPAADPATVKELRALVNELTNRLELMEAKFEATHNALDAMAAKQSSKSSPVAAHPARASGQAVAPVPAETDPEFGFTNDDAVQTYRKAMVLVQTRRYTDALTQLSAFLEKYPDHPLAGGAQYYMGHAYLRQKEYKLAIQEYQRVLTSYDRSSHIAGTLRELAEAEDALKQTESASRHRQLLMSLFPHSPAAVSTASKETHAPAPVPAAAPASTENSAAPAMSPPTAPLDPVPTETHPATDPNDP